MVPMFIKSSKSLIENGKEVDFEKDKSTQDGILRDWYDGSDAFGIDLNSFDSNTTDIIMGLISNKLQEGLNLLKIIQIILKSIYWMKILKKSSECQMML